MTRAAAKRLMQVSEGSLHRAKVITAKAIPEVVTLAQGMLTAHDALGLAVRELAEQGRPVPCAGDARWISDDRDARRQAAELCGGCPAIRQCAAAADEVKACAAVWAGIDRTPGRTPRDPKDRT